MTTATSRPYTGADVPQGPAEVWIKASLPAANVPVALHTDGSLDGLTNATAVFLGKLRDGARWSYKPSLFEGKSDESPSSFRRLIEEENFMISGEWMENQSAVKLAAMMVGATSVAVTGPPAGTLLTVGGLTIPPTFSVVLVWTQPEAPTKFISVQIYKALNSAGIENDITKKKLGGSPFEFQAQSVDTRAVGDRLGAVFIYT
jgi:hypothetical protein